MCVVLPLLHASALHLFFTSFVERTRIHGIRRSLFDYEVSSFNVERHDGPSDWYTIFFFFSEKTSRSQRQVPLKALPVHTILSSYWEWTRRITLKAEVVRMNPAELRGRHVDGILALSYFFLEGFLTYGRPLTRPNGPWLDYGQRINDLALFFHCSFVLFRITPYGLDGYPELVMGSPFGFVLFLLRRYIHFLALPQGSRDYQQSQDEEKTGHQIRKLTFAKEVWGTLDNLGSMKNEQKTILAKIVPVSKCNVTCVVV